MSSAVGEANYAKGTCRRLRAPTVLKARVLFVLLVLGASQIAMAGDCTIPGSHPTIQAAIDDHLCTEITLAAQTTYTEHLHINRSLQLGGPPEGGATVQGQINLTGPMTVALLTNFRIESGCSSGTLRVSDGAQMNGSGLHMLFSQLFPCIADLFISDGFEG